MKDEFKELSEIIETDMEKRVKIDVPFESLVLFSTALGCYRDWVDAQTELGLIDENIRNVMYERVESSIDFLVKVMMEEGEEMYNKLNELDLFSLLRNPENTTLQ